MKNILLEVSDSRGSNYIPFVITDEEYKVFTHLSKDSWVKSYKVGILSGLPDREVQRNVSSMRQKGVPIISSYYGLKIGVDAIDILAYCEREISKAYSHKDTVLREMKAIMDRILDEDVPPPPPKPWWKIW